MEQKNWSRVRQLVGYLRYDTAAELELLNEIWELDRIFTNYLLPQQKLIAKVRHGAKVSKTHDRAATPHRRAAADPALARMPVIRMNACFKKIRPAALSVARTGPGEGDAVLDAELEELVVDELTAVIRVDADDGKREDRQDVLQGREDLLLSPCSARTGSRSSRSRYP
ncbi:hypothetical protein QK291_02830 [Arthrobacter sp. AL12]|nr:hypothetical protein [Arthrobacter sp. AL12]MDI3210992.1 hypothetical protein [Arthrobacter sp. AL12]